MRILRVALILIAFSFINTSLFAQSAAGGSTFEDAVPFCTNDPVFSTPFEACFAGSTDSSCSNVAEAGPDYGCLGSQPSPTWYFLQIGQDGDIDFQITQNTAIDDDGTPTGTGLDVDYIIWGPFSDIDVFDQLTAENIESCSFSSAAVEFPTITGAQEGDFYVFMVTNFSNVAAEIFIEQISDPASTGSGATDCSIVSASIGRNQDVCEGTPVTLDATSADAVSYSWAVDTGAGFMPVLDGSGNQVTTATLEVTTTGEYQVTITDAAGDTGTDEAVITFLELPNPNTTPDALEVCDTITDIDADGDGVIDAGSGSNTDGFEVFDLTPAITQIANGEQVDVIVYTDLTIAESNPDDTSQAIPDVTAFTNTVVGTQTLYARVERNVPGNSDIDSDGNLCYEVVPFEVIVNALPVLTQQDPFQYTICEARDTTDTMASVNLDNLADKVGLLVAPQIKNDFIITYHELEPQAAANTDALSTPYEVTDGQELFVRIENVQTGCLNFTSIVFTVGTIPDAFTAPNLVQCADNLGVNSIPDQSVSTFDLTQQNETITGNIAANTVNYYTSRDDAENMVNVIATPSAFVNTENPQTIFARSVNAARTCQSDDIIEFELFAQPLPYTNLTDEGGPFCVDEITREALDPFTIDGTVESPQPGANYTYAWTLDGNPVSSVSVVNVDAPGTYELTITADYGGGILCDYVAEAVYIAESAPVFEATVVESSFNTGGLYTVEISNITGANPDSEYVFAVDDGPFFNSTILTNVRPGTHTIFGKLASGNCSVSEVEIDIIDYPRFFTPNADGFHDTWNIIGLGVAPNLNAKIFIFDRYGKLLKQISPVGAGWDGTFNGQPMPSSDYWFRVEFTEVDEEGTQRTVNGHFTLKR